MSGQTPCKAPWFVEVVYTPDGWVHQIHGDRNGISAVLVAELPIHFRAVPEGPHATWDKQAANASLIAAAPELAQAVLELRDHLILKLAPSGIPARDLKERNEARDAVARSGELLKKAGWR